MPGHEHQLPGVGPAGNILGVVGSSHSPGSIVDVRCPVDEVESYEVHVDCLPILGLVCRYCSPVDLWSQRHVGNVHVQRRDD